MFKAAQMYRINNLAHQRHLNDADALAEDLAGLPEGDPTGSQWRKMGFGIPCPSMSEDLVWSGPNCNLFTLFTSERQLTGATIREHVLKRVVSLEEKESRKLYRKEIAQIKDDVVATLLPKAFVKHSFTRMLVIGDLLIVDASSAKKAEDALDCLRVAIGSLSVAPVRTQQPLSTLLRDRVQATSSLARDNTIPLHVLDQAKFVDSEKNVVTFKGCDLTEDEPQEYLAKGFTIAEVAMAFEDKMSFKINDQFILKSIKLDDLLTTQNTNDANDDAAAAFDGLLMIFADTMSKLVQLMFEWWDEERREVTENWEFARRKAVDLLDKAAELVQDEHVSIEVLRNQLHIGAGQAKKLLELMQIAGLVDSAGSNLKAKVAEGELTAAQRLALMEQDANEESEDDRRRRLHGHIASSGEEPAEELTAEQRASNALLNLAQAADEDEEDEFEVAARRLAQSEEDDDL